MPFLVNIFLFFQKLYCMYYDYEKNKHLYLWLELKKNILLFPIPNACPANHSLHLKNFFIIIIFLSKIFPFSSRTGELRTSMRRHINVKRRIAFACVSGDLENTKYIKLVLMTCSGVVTLQSSQRPTAERLMIWLTPYYVFGLLCMHTQRSWRKSPWKPNTCLTAFANYKCIESSSASGCNCAQPTFTRYSRTLTRLIIRLETEYMMSWVGLSVSESNKPLYLQTIY